MRIELDKAEIENLIEILKSGSIDRRIHRWLRPNCRKCKNAIITINKMNDAILGNNEVKE